MPRICFKGFSGLCNINFFFFLFFSFLDKEKIVKRVVKLERLNFFLNRGNAIGKANFRDQIWLYLIFIQVSHATQRQSC